MKNIFIILIFLCLVTCASAAQLEVGDNQTYPNVTSAIAAANASDIINIHAGTYDEKITIDKSLTIQSDTGIEDDVIMHHPSGTSGSIVINANNVVIDGITLIEENSSSGSWSSSSPAIYASGRDGITVNNCKIWNQDHTESAYGIWTYSCCNFTITNCEFINKFSYAVYLSNEVATTKPNVYIDNNEFRVEFDDVVMDEALYVRGSSLSGMYYGNVTATNNVIRNSENWTVGNTVGGYVECGFSFSDIQGITVHDNDFITYNAGESLDVNEATNAEIYDNDLEGGYFLSYDSTNINIYDNEIHSYTISAIYMSGDQANCEIYRNNVTVDSGAEEFCMELRFSNGIEAYENTLNNRGIYLYKYDTSCNLHDNEINNCPLGIYIYNLGTSPAHNVHSNTFNNCDTGIKIVDSKTNVFSDNVFDINNYGIYIQNVCPSNSFINNTFETDSETSTGIYFTGSDYSTTLNNEFSQNKFYSSTLINTSSGYEDVVDIQIWDSVTETTYKDMFGISHTGIVGNYWLGYEGEDTDNDGIGETAFEIFSGVFDYYPLISNEEEEEETEEENDNGYSAVIIALKNINDNNQNTDTDENIIDDQSLLIETLLELDLLEINDLNGDESTLEVMKLVVNNENNKGTLTIIFLLLILIAIGIYYYYDEIKNNPKNKRKLRK